MLFGRGYQVTGLLRCAHTQPLGSSERLRGRIELIHAYLLDSETLTAAVAHVRGIICLPQDHGSSAIKPGLAEEMSWAI